MKRKCLDDLMYDWHYDHHKIIKYYEFEIFFLHKGSSAAMICLVRHFVGIRHDAAVAYGIQREMTAACPPTGFVRSRKLTVAAHVYTLPFLHFKRRKKIIINYSTIISYYTYRIPITAFNNILRYFVYHARLRLLNISF